MSICAYVSWFVSFNYHLSRKYNLSLYSNCMKCISLFIHIYPSFSPSLALSLSLSLSLYIYIYIYIYSPSVCLYVYMSLCLYNLTVICPGNVDHLFFSILYQICSPFIHICSCISLSLSLSLSLSIYIYIYVCMFV
jgi:hypothetical protein